MSLALVFPAGTILAALLVQTTRVEPIVPPSAAPAATAPVAFTPTVRPHLRAVRTPERPKIDGKLDDLWWQRAIPSDGFTQHFPDEGAPPTERTTVRVLYDDDAIYIGIDCEQLHAPVVKRLMRRDTQLPSDGVWLDIDSRRDGLTAYHFSVNAAGVLGDAIHFNDLDYSSDWDAVWEGKAADTPRGYSVEIRIPLYVLRFDALPVQDWGFEVRRFIEARQETDDWAFIPRSAGSYVPLMGRLDDLDALHPRHALQVSPFLFGRERHRAADSVASQGTLAHGWDTAVAGGLDAKVGLANDLTLDLTLLPDFGQVEADAVILNLSTYETFFPEKRPFFLEGIDTFSTLRTLLYTRRIGHAPATPTITSGTETLVDLPEPSPIYGAAKLMGTVGSHTTVGVLSALTGQNDVDVVTPTGTVARTAEPTTAYNVVRLKRLIGADSSVGMLATATNRIEPFYTPMAACPASISVFAAADGRCTNDAYAFSVDGRWRSPRGDYALGGQALATALVHGPARAESDGIATNPGTLAGGASLDFDKVGGKHWLWSLDQQISGRQLEFNDLGYLDRKNDYLGMAQLTYRTIEPVWKTVETRSTLAVDWRRTLDGIDLANGGSFNEYWLLSNYWYVYAQADYRGSYHDDREMGDGTALQRAARWGGEASVSGNPRRRLLWSLYGQALHIDGGGQHLEAHGQVTLRVLPQLELDLLPTVTSDEGEPRYVATITRTTTTTGTTASAQYLLGRQEARSLGATVRAAYTFTPELSLQVYSQAFLARVHYPSFLETPLVGYRQKVDLSSLLPPPTPLAAYDTLTATLNVNVVLRWEYRLGSTAYLVYTRAQQPALAPAVGGATSLDVHPILNGSAAIDVLMVKLAYWFG
ncbi:MAG TPA: DUF5916 domain-containing protein [Polyangia bacterium]|nr:DUF5916 domain-containing protein [Polyangia bacterium]